MNVFLAKSWHLKRERKLKLPTAKKIFKSSRRFQIKKEEITQIITYSLRYGTNAVEIWDTVKNQFRVKAKQEEQTDNKTAESP